MRNYFGSLIQNTLIECMTEWEGSSFLEQGSTILQLRTLTIKYHLALTNVNINYLTFD